MSEYFSTEKSSFKCVFILNNLHLILVFLFRFIVCETFNKLGTFVAVHWYCLFFIWLPVAFAQSNGCSIHYFYETKDNIIQFRWNNSVAAVYMRKKTSHPTEISGTFRWDLTIVRWIHPRKRCAFTD